MGFFFSLAKVVISSDLRSIMWVYVTLPRYTPLSATETNEKDQRVVTTAQSTITVRRSTAMLAFDHNHKFKIILPSCLRRQGVPAFPLSSLLQKS